MTFICPLDQEEEDDIGAGPSLLTCPSSHGGTKILAAQGLPAGPRPLRPPTQGASRAIRKGQASRGQGHKGLAAVPQETDLGVCSGPRLASGEPASSGNT